jgi:hypothetical protein
MKLVPWAWCYGGFIGVKSMKYQLAHVCLLADRIRQQSCAGINGAHTLSHRQAAQAACREAGLDDLVPVIELLVTYYEGHEWSRRTLGLEG